MHHIHHTEGIILSSKNYGEAGKYYFVFTRDLGMLCASAQGVRKISSKLRYILQDFSYVKMDFVRGKDFWRITSASKTNKLGELKKQKEKLAILFNISNLLKRLLAGEEANPALFDDLVHGFSFLEKSEANDHFSNIEVIIVLRILDNLGYLAKHEVLEEMVRSPFEENLVFEASRKRAKILSEINKALGESQL
jgi:DNA repair protein RecO